MPTSMWEPNCKKVRSWRGESKSDGYEIIVEMMLGMSLGKTIAKVRSALSSCPGIPGLRQICIANKTFMNISALQASNGFGSESSLAESSADGS